MGERASADSSLFSDLVALMARLRGPSGCPWDREQDHRTLRPCLLEETYEVLEAIDRGDAQALRQELGDLLLQVVFHAQLASEAGDFDIEDVVKGIHDKLIARHPHVFGQTSVETPEEVLHQWDRLKRDERGENGGDVLAQVPKALPALARAQTVQRRAARAGAGRAAEEAGATACAALGLLSTGKLEPHRAQEAVGELLLAVAELARAAGVDAEQALRESVDKFLSELVRGAPDSSRRPRAGPG
jgi:MazG family protein